MIVELGKVTQETKGGGIHHENSPPVAGPNL
jgi:hypothetical protein